MPRTRTALAASALTAAVAASAAALAASAGAAPGPTATAAGGASVKIASTAIGKILVSKSNFTLYMFTRDRHGKDSCVKVSMCTGTWPPYTTKGKPAAGPGVKKSLLGTLNIGHGHTQVTYAGHPLYTYAFDSGPKATSYVGAAEFGGKWDALSAAGRSVK